MIMKTLNLFKLSSKVATNRRIIKIFPRYFSNEEGKKDESPTTDTTSSQEQEVKKETTKSLEDITYVDFKNLFNTADQNIDNGVYYLKAIPDNNYFGEIPVYICPTYLFHSVRPVELSGLAVTSALAYLSYYKIIFTYSIFFPFYSFLALLSLSRIINIRKSDNMIMSISLLDESKVRIQFLNGKEIETNLKNVHVSTGFMTNLNSFDDAKIARINKHNAQKNLLSTLVIYLTIDNVRTCPLLLRAHNFTPGKLDKAALAFINSELFYGVINKRTKKLSLKEN
jgi:hypothetical protein